MNEEPNNTSNNGLNTRRNFVGMGLTHLAIQEELDGKVVEWMEHVGDEQYQTPTT